MELVKDLIVLLAKILIFIGDVVIAAVKFVRKLFGLATSVKTSRKVKEQEIYNGYHREFKLPKVSLPKIEISKPRLPKLSFPKLLNLSLPSFKLPKIKNKRSKFQVPDINFLEPMIVKPWTPKIHKSRLPKLHFEHLFIRIPKKRGRKRRLAGLIPAAVKVRYVFAGAVLSFIFVFLPITSIIFLQNLPNPSQLSTQDIAQTTKIYDRNHTLLYSMYADQNRTNIPLSRVPKNLINATIAIEDKSFYSNSGVDFPAIVRSAIGNLQHKPLQGGSTITQQLVRARLLTPQRSLDRKLKEIVLSIWTQRIYSKNQILEMYLNQVPYGGTSWGVEAAAQTYFNKDAKDLDLAESAFLAGLPQAPSIYSPYSYYKGSWKQRQKDVLNRMVQEHFISRKQKDQALAEKLTFQPEKQILHAPYFVMYVKDLLEKEYGLPIVERGGLNVVTSLDLKTQDMAQKVVADEVDKAGYLNFTNGASLITNPKNGDILAMVGGKNYYDENGGNYNVTTALRQPGSTIKVITYSAALMNGFTAATSISDTPVAFKSGTTVYSPVNYDGKFHGNLTLRQALANSVNVPAVKTLNQIGIPTMVDLAKRMGISTWSEPDQYGLAVTLGAAEVKMTDMAQVYGTLANQGQKVDINPILKVTDYNGNVLEEKSDVNSTQVLPKDVAFIISNILADNNARQMEFGLNSPLVIPNHIVSVKTGTTDNKRDNWTIGYTPNVLVAVWVGNNNNAPMNPILASGITGAAPIWHQIMTNLLAKSDKTAEMYPQPDTIVVKPCNGRDEYFVQGTDRVANCHPISINNQIPTGLRR